MARTDETGTDTPAPPSSFEGETAGRPDGGTVQLAYCHTGRVSHSWHVSMMDLLVFDKTQGADRLQSAPIRVACSGPYGIIEGRNLAASRFLDETDHDWLFWVDTDMGFRPDSLERLLAAAHPEDRPVVGGLCFAAQTVRSDDHGGYVIRPVPTLFSLTKIGEMPVYVSRMTYKPDRMNRVAGTGSAFILIHRSVLEAIRAEQGDSWYTPVAFPGGKPISEDLAFCSRVGGLDKPIFVHTGVKVTHHKEIWLGETDYEMPEIDPIFG